MKYLLQHGMVHKQKPPDASNNSHQFYLGVCQGTLILMLSMAYQWGTLTNLRIALGQSVDQIKSD
jgi:hypothetical protein